MRIVCVVDGGCLRNVYCDEAAEVELIDLDSLEVEDDEDLAMTKDEVEVKLNEIADEMVEVF